jgi:hypothetical protein
MGLAAAGSSLGGVIYPIVFYRLQPTIGFAWATRVIGFIALFGLIITNATFKVRVLPAARRKFLDLSAFTELPYNLFLLGSFVGFMGLYGKVLFTPLSHHETDTWHSLLLLHPILRHRRHYQPKHSLLPPLHPQRGFHIRSNHPELSSRPHWTNEYDRTLRLHSWCPNALPHRNTHGSAVDSSLCSLRLFLGHLRVAATNYLRTLDKEPRNDWHKNGHGFLDHRFWLVDWYAYLGCDLEC